MNAIASLKAREAALLADRARVDEALRDIRAAIAGAEAVVAEAKAIAEASAEEKPE